MTYACHMRADLMRASRDKSYLDQSRFHIVSEVYDLYRSDLCQNRQRISFAAAGPVLIEERLPLFLRRAGSADLRDRDYSDLECADYLFF